jgi:two-component system, NtrC family, response regulator GlrR
MRDTLLQANSRPARLEPGSSAPIELIGASAAIGRVQELMRRTALLDSGVLLVGERGADAPAIARELHTRSRPAGAPWIVVDCGADDAARIDRRLFGTARNHGPTDLELVSSDSHTVAARGGTLFLQDVTELPSAIQTRLTRIARDGEVRVDGEVVPTEVRFVASALPSIDGDVREHRFRADLYRRLAVSRIDLPPLRDRLEDLPMLATRLLEEYPGAQGGPPRTFTQSALALLAAHCWPGNLAELRALVERVVAETRDPAIQIEQLLPVLQLERATTAFVPVGSLRDARLRFERDYIAAVLQHHGWRMADAAQTLGIQRPNLYRKARQLGIPLARVPE